MLGRLSKWRKFCQSGENSKVACWGKPFEVMMLEGLRERRKGRRRRRRRRRKRRRRKRRRKRRRRKRRRRME